MSQPGTGKQQPQATGQQPQATTKKKRKPRKPKSTFFSEQQFKQNYGWKDPGLLALFRVDNLDKEYNPLVTTIIKRANANAKYLKKEGGVSGWIPGYGTSQIQNRATTYTKLVPNLTGKWAPAAEGRMWGFHTELPDDFLNHYSAMIRKTGNVIDASRGEQYANDFTDSAKRKLLLDGLLGSSANCKYPDASYITVNWLGVLTTLKEFAPLSIYNSAERDITSGDEFQKRVNEKLKLLPSLPKTLVVITEREETQGGWLKFRTKSTSLRNYTTAFPLLLSASPTVNMSGKYKLTSIVTTTSEIGKYTVYVLNPVDGRWYKYANIPTDCGVWNSKDHPGHVIGHTLPTAEISRTAIMYNYSLQRDDAPIAETPAPTQTTETSAQTTETPAQAPAQTTGTSAQTTGTSAQTTGTSAQTTGTSAQAPAQTTGTSAQTPGISFSVTPQKITGARIKNSEYYEIIPESDPKLQEKLAKNPPPSTGLAEKGEIIVLPCDRSSDCLVKFMTPPTSEINVVSGWEYVFKTTGGSAKQVTPLYGLKGDPKLATALVGSAAVLVDRTTFGLIDSFIKVRSDNGSGKWIKLDKVLQFDKTARKRFALRDIGLFEIIGLL